MISQSVMNTANWIRFFSQFTCVSTKLSAVRKKKVQHEEETTTEFCKSKEAKTRRVPQTAHFVNSIGVSKTIAVPQIPDIKQSEELKNICQHNKREIDA